MMQKIYKITYRGRTYWHLAEDAIEAAKKFECRKVFGRLLVGQMRLKQYDAETRGEEWALYVADGAEVWIEREM